MPEVPEAVLVYSRVAANVRRTRLLVVLFALVLVPVVSAATAYALPLVSVLSIFVASGAAGPEPFMERVLAMDAELQAAQPRGGFPGFLDLPSAILWLTVGLLILALVVVAIGFAAITAFLAARYGSRMLLRAAHAQPLNEGEVPDFFRLVENLCIGAGLPRPRLYIVESPSPNAFATGPDPQRASLVVTRGLLTLLDRRELQGVVAHELSHIGNQDTRLATLLAAVVGAASLPWRICVAPLRYAVKSNPAVSVFIAFFTLVIGSSVFAGFRFGLSYLMSEEASTELPTFLWWWAMHSVLAPAYALFVAPVAALVIRQGVSRQRELLADADAVRLTRDPEGLALALAKIGAAEGEALRVGEGSVHLYIVDPRGAQSLLHRVFPSHPPVKDRIELLARMGSGIPQPILDAAIEVGRQWRDETSSGSEVVAASMDQAGQPEATSLADNATAEHWPLPSMDEPLQPRLPSQSLVFLYEKPDGWSKVVGQLDENAALTALGREGAFVQVVTADNLRGYVSSSARLTALRRDHERPKGPRSD